MFELANGTRLTYVVVPYDIYISTHSLITLSVHELLVNSGWIDGL